LQKDGFAGLLELILENGVLMGLVTYFLLPLVAFPVFIRILFVGKMQSRMFPKRVVGE
jgi:hypothetical protein